ncbi:hypothetical protein TCON_1760 [Astathelohania contejeani]|uniref:Uncharacterized protein n=1 Tax=Astathelohania contejeani TaxID=164912 RepID=A0ABQ7HY01_9MICR|nr:hypothetical protein TCON_1760 [Thelohania contejeani]
MHLKNGSIEKDNSSDEEFYFMMMESEKNERIIKQSKDRDKAFKEKDIGYTKTLEIMNPKIKIFLGYLNGYKLLTENILYQLADLILKKNNSLEHKIEYIINNRIKNIKEIIEILEK